MPEMARDSYLSERTRGAIFCEFGFWDYLFALQCSHAVPPAAKTEDRPSEKVADRQTEQRADIGPLIEDQLERLGKFKGYALERENLAVDAAARSFSLPPRLRRTSSSVTKLTWIDSFIAPWTSWRVCNGGAEAKPYHRFSTSIWGRELDFCETKPRSAMFSMNTSIRTH